MQRWYSVLGKAIVTASFIPVKPSAQRTKISFSPLFFKLLRISNQYYCFHYLKFACMNLKKLAGWKARISPYFIKNLKKYLKIEKTAINFLFLMTVCLQSKIYLHILYFNFFIILYCILQIY